MGLNMGEEQSTPYSTADLTSFNQNDPLNPISDVTKHQLD